MYRVELKVRLFSYKVLMALVPNVPCGVERPVKVLPSPIPCFVPNVPCGVESYIIREYNMLE